MTHISSRCTLSLAGLLLILCFFIFFINESIYHYHGNNFFPENVPLIAVLLILFNIGLRLSFARKSNFCIIGQELFFFFGVMALIALVTNAVQLTPFQIIDPKIISLEQAIHINLNSLLKWTNQYPLFKNLLTVIYGSLNYQMCILPLIVIFTCRFHVIREYYFLLLCTTLLGFGFYYFFPTIAPASFMDHALFSKEQIATGLKFKQIHHYINPTTDEGGLIALPSFHAIWAVLCVNLLKEWIVPCIILGITNVFLIASCVLLGWHYVTDLAGSLGVLLISFYFLKRCQIKSNRSRICASTQKSKIS